MRLAISLIVLISSNFVFSQNQEEEFLNSILKDELKKDSVYILNNYVPYRYLLGNNDKLYKKALEWHWQDATPCVQKPLLNLMLYNFSLEEINEDLNSKKNDTLINYNFKDRKIYKVNQDFVLKHKNKSFVKTSKPLFNKQRNWAIVIIGFFTPYSYDSGLVRFYVKINDEWLLYYSYTAWMS